MPKTRCLSTKTGFSGAPGVLTFFKVFYSFHLRSTQHGFLIGKKAKRFHSTLELRVLVLLLHFFGG